MNNKLRSKQVGIVMEEIKYFCHLRRFESTFPSEFKVTEDRLGSRYRLICSGVEVAELDCDFIDFYDGTMKRSFDKKYSIDWLLNNGNEELTLVYTPRNMEYKIDGNVVAKLDHGGGVYESILMLVKQRKWLKPDPYWRIVFDENLLAPRYAAAILMAHDIF